MKNYTFLAFFFLVSVSVFSQSHLEVKGYFGVSEALANRKVDLDAASSVTMKNFNEVGVLLSKNLSEKLSLSGGLNYSFANAEFSLPYCFDCYPGSTYYVHNPDYNMLSIPAFAEYALGNYFYAAAGPILDFQLSEGNNFSS